MVEKENIEEIRTRKPFSLRRMTEVMAMYEKKILRYQELMSASNGNRQQRMEVYAEIKMLGWVLFKSEQDVQRDLKVAHINQ